MRTTHLMWFIYASYSLVGCGTYSTSEKESKPMAVLTADKTSVQRGDSIQLDASTSIYDSLGWTINGNTLDVCGTSDVCLLKMDSIGSFEVSVAATTTTTASASVVINVVEPSVNRTTSSSSATSGSSSAAAIPFYPNDVAGLDIWFDANDPAGTGSIPADGPLSSWVDRSGGNNATAVNSPIFLSNMQNGRPMVQFDGVNDQMTGTMVVNGLTTMTIFAVSANLANQYMGFSTQYPLIEWNETSSWGNVHLSPLQHQTNWRFGTGTSGNWPNVTYGTASAVSLTSASKNGALEELYIDGRLMGKVTDRATTIAATSSTFRLASDGTNFLNSNVGEILVYNTALSAADRLKVTCYLKEKWGLSAVEGCSASTIPTVTAVAPSSISGLNVWFDADDPSGNGVQPSNGAAITTWVDKSTANDSTANNAGGGNSPIYVTGALNNKPVVRFDGVNDYLTGTYAVNGKTQMTIIAVSAALATYSLTANDNYSLIRWSESSSWGVVGLSANQNQTTWRFGTGQSGNEPWIYYPVGNTFNIRSMVKNGASEKFYMNGIQLGQTGGKTTTIANTGSTFDLSKESTHYLNQDMAEILVYNGALTQAQIQGLECYFHNKWGISVPYNCQ